MYISSNNSGTCPNAVPGLGPRKWSGNGHCGAAAIIYLPLLADFSSARSSRTNAAYPTLDPPSMSRSTPSKTALNEESVI